MFCNTLEAIKIQNQAWIDAKTLCRGAATLGTLIGASPSRVKNWINYPGMKIPYEYAVRAARITKISLNRLYPFASDINNDFKFDNYSVELLLEVISVKDFITAKYDKPERPILVSTNGLLISGLAQFEALQSAGKEKASVIVLDLEALLLKINSIKYLNVDFLINEIIAIGLHLEQLVGNRQGQRTDLGKIQKYAPQNIKNDLPLSSPGYEVIGRTEENIAEIIGLGSKDTYHRAKKIYKNGIPALMDALRNKQLSIKSAAGIASFPPEQQLDHLQLELKGVKEL